MDKFLLSSDRNQLSPTYEEATVAGMNPVPVPAVMHSRPESGTLSGGLLAPQDQLSQALGYHENLTFKVIQKFGFNARTMVVQIRDSAGQPIMSTLMDPGMSANAPYHRDGTLRHQTTYRSGATTSFTNAQGNIVMTSKESGRSQMVSCGSRVLGLVDGVGLFSTALKTSSALGVVLFETNETNGIFSFELNGVQMARAGRILAAGSREDFSVEFSSALDLNTKAMVVATAYHVYYLHFAETILGIRGARGVQKVMCLCFLATTMIMVLLVIVFVTVSTVQLDNFKAEHGFQ